MNTASDKEIRLHLLKILKEEPQLTQREMKNRMGISLGKVNYCISGLVQKGMIQVERFKKNSKNTAYFYHLTPKGVEELRWLTLNFLKIRLEEYDQIKDEINTLSNQVKRLLPDFDGNVELLERLNKIV